MSVESVSDSSHGVAGLDVLRAVAAARRRLRTVALLRLAAVTAPVGVAAGAALALTGVAPAWTAGALGLVGTGAAAAWAAVHTPALTAVARQLDAQLGLRDRVAAAVQLQQSGGPIAALVARDAAARLAPVRMAAVFPLSIGRLPAVAAAIAVASVAWLVSIDAGAPLATSVPAPAAGDAANSEAGTPARNSARSDARADAGSDARADETRQRSVNAPGRTADARATNDRGTATREAFTSAPARGTASAAHEAREAPQTADGRRNGTAAPATTNTSRENGRSGAGAGASARGALTAGAGGVASGNALSADARSIVATPVAGSYRTARAGAEAALARDVIPPDYRDHVRAYFRALTQEGTR